MSRSHGFDVTVNWDDGEAIRSIRVKGKISEYRPAVMYLRNGDPGYPAEGGEIEDYKIYAEDGTEIDDSDGKILAAVEDEVYEKASEDAECAAENRYDAQRER